MSLSLMLLRHESKAGGVLEVTSAPRVSGSTDEWFISVPRCAIAAVAAAVSAAAVGLRPVSEPGFTNVTAAIKSFKLNLWPDPTPDTPLVDALLWLIVGLARLPPPSLELLPALLLSSLFRLQLERGSFLVLDSGVLLLLLCLLLFWSETFDF